MPRVLAGTVAAHRRQTLERVFKAFESLLYERGYDAITLAEIAKESGMARTAIYTYFPDKEKLLLAYTDHEMDEFFSRLRIELYRVDEPLERLLIFVRMQLEYIASHHLPPGRALRSVLSGAGYEAMRRHADTLESVLSAILTDAAADGFIPEQVAGDEHTLGLVISCLGSAHIGNLAGRDLESAIGAAQAFVLRAVGVGSAEFPDGRR